VEAGEGGPRQGQNGQRQERVVEPEATASVDTHRTHVLTNGRSSQLFSATQMHLGGRPWSRRSVVLLAAAVVLSAGCGSSPQRLQLAHLLERLATARAGLAENPPLTGANCDDVGDVKSHLAGEPGLDVERPAWVELRASSDALEAACGQADLLEQPAGSSPAVFAARARWQAGLQHELDLACEHLRRAAGALQQPAPC
jgi:hypothetical protein